MFNPRPTLTDQLSQTGSFGLLPRQGFGVFLRFEVRQVVCAFAHSDEADRRGGCPPSPRPVLCRSQAPLGNAIPRSAASRRSGIASPTGTIHPRRGIGGMPLVIVIPKFSSHADKTQTSETNMTRRGNDRDKNRTGRRLTVRREPSHPFQPPCPRQFGGNSGPKYAITIGGKSGMLPGTHADNSPRVPHKSKSSKSLPSLIPGGCQTKEPGL